MVQLVQHDAQRIADRLWHHLVLPKDWSGWRMSAVIENSCRLSVIRLACWWCALADSRRPSHLDAGGLKDACLIAGFTRKVAADLLGVYGTERIAAAYAA
jgi:hypothetical protein